ncbi:MAG: adenylate/guanylate cyclase domain-containing protein [Roseiarcus sp.]
MADRRDQGSRRLGEGLHRRRRDGAVRRSEALEDAPPRACRSGLSIHQRLAAAASTFESQYGSRPQMRIGVNSGLAVVARIFSQDAAVTALGDTVNLASRLQKLAEPGTVYLSESTRRLVEGQAETVFAGEFDIKGKSEPQKVYRLDSVRPGATRFETSVFRGLSAYVGRERELQLLERSLADARQRVCIIDVVAEPGMGKSRLLYEFRRRLSDGRAFLLQGSCSPDGRQTPFRTSSRWCATCFRSASWSRKTRSDESCSRGSPVSS